VGRTKKTFKRPKGGVKKVYHPEPKKIKTVKNSKKKGGSKSGCPISALARRRRLRSECGGGMMPIWIENKAIREQGGGKPWPETDQHPQSDACSLQKKNPYSECHDTKREQSLGVRKRTEWWGRGRLGG